MGKYTHVVEKSIQFFLQDRISSHYSNGQIFEIVGHALSFFLQNVYNQPLYFFYWHVIIKNWRNFFAENEEKTWGELGCFCQCSITENPYISRAFDAQSSKQYRGFWIRVAPEHIAPPRRAKLFFENKKVLSRSRERTSKQNDAKFQAKSMRNYAKSVSHISFIGFRKQVAEEHIKKSAVIQRKSSWKSVNYILISPWICAMIIPSRIMGG